MRASYFLLRSRTCFFIDSSFIAKMTVRFVFMLTLSRIVSWFTRLVSSEMASRGKPESKIRFNESALDAARDR